MGPCVGLANGVERVTLEMSLHPVRLRQPAACLQGDM